MNVEINLKKTTTADLIYQWYEAKEQGSAKRGHLGASIIGDQCKRKIWYTFRWALPANFSGRMLRLFDRGNEEENRFTKELRSIGCQVVNIDPNTGKQYQFSDCGGHFGGSFDGAVLGLRESPKTWHVLEYKTSNDKKFNELMKAQSVEAAQPRHFAQMQCYMGWSGMTRAIYFCTNKNDDSIYSERVKFDKSVFEFLRAKAKMIIDANEPPERLSDNPSWYQCKMCDYHGLCHENKVPQVNCRTCAHSTPILEGKWKCDAFNDEIDLARQAEGCLYHLFNPKLMPAEVVDGDTTRVPMWVEYKKTDGTVFRNITSLGGGEGYLSSELHHCHPSLVGDKTLDMLRVGFDAKIQETAK
jgi:hypothetical protein